MEEKNREHIGAYACVFDRDELPDGTLDSKEDILGLWELAEKAFKKGQGRS